ncbi:26987_t:CDS:2, partial [Racocetra persica]
MNSVLISSTRPSISILPTPPTRPSTPIQPTSPTTPSTPASSTTPSTPIYLTSSTISLVITISPSAIFTLRQQYSTLQLSGSTSSQRQQSLLEKDRLKI